ncbi:glycosyltransferase family 2 protein [soil metagenome]
MSDTPLPTTAVVTVSYNSGAHLRQFLSSIRSNESTSVTIVVADNGSTDIAETRVVCAEFSATLLELGFNSGYGGGMNRAIATLSPEITTVLISNPDVNFPGGAIGTLVEALDSLPHSAAVGPRVLNADGSIYPSARELPSLRTGVGHAVLGRIRPDNPWTKRYLSDFSESTEPRQSGWLSGSCLMVRRSAFESIGGFDDAFFMYFEDVDLGYRFGKSGWQNTYYPASVVTHTGAHSTATESSRMIEAHHQSAYRYLSRRYSAWYLTPLRIALRAGLEIRSRWLTRR